MRKSIASFRTESLERRKKFLGLTMGLLCFDSVNQGMAHGAAGGVWTPVTGLQPNVVHNYQPRLLSPLRYTAPVDGTPSGTASSHPSNSHGINSNSQLHHQNFIAPLIGGAGLIPHASSYTTEAGQPGHALDLDLTSTSSIIVLGTRLFNGAASVTIDVGGSKQTFSPGAKVTAAEYVAIKEQLGSGQTITLNGQGAAVGGSFTTNGIVTSSVDGLVIPRDVTALDYFSSAKTLSLSGDLINFGSLYGVSTSTNTRSGSIFASDITNEVGGVISTELKNSALVANALSGVSLNLVAQDSIANHGTIASAGFLTLDSGNGGISNTSCFVGPRPGPPGSPTPDFLIKGPAPSITAQGDVSLHTGTGNLSNDGTINAQHGSINIDAPKNSDININATGGTFNAANGNINVRDAFYNGSANVNMTGGNYLSQNLNIYSGKGAITGNVGQVTGKLNTSGDAAHFTANTANLYLGTNKLAGDPTFVNDAGDITIDGEVTAAEAITIIASGNILATGDAFIHTNDSSAGSPPDTSVTLIAGAHVTDPGATTTTVLPGAAASVSVTADGTGATGGNIDLTGSGHFLGLS